MTKKIGLIVGILALVTIIAFTMLAYRSANQPDPLANLKSGLEKLASGAYSESPIGKFNHIDQDAEALHLEAMKLSESNQLAQAVELLERAIEDYQGFHGYHYFAVKRSLSAVYQRRGDKNIAIEMMKEITAGQLELLEQESRDAPQQ